MMKQLVQTFPQQLREALTIGKEAQIRPPKKDIRKVFIAGMGGSGIGANFVESFVRDECPVPIVIGKGYDIPAFVDEHTLCIASSYSGNTEETLSAFEQMVKAQAKVVCIASGGKLIEQARDAGCDFILLPKGKPAPRACLGYSLVQQLWVLRRLGLISEQPLKAVAAAAQLLDDSQDEIRRKAETLAYHIQDKLPVIYTTDRMEAVAVRFRQQLNENAKMLGWHHVLPEMNHNELVGWRNDDPRLAVIWLRNRDDFQRNAVRMDITQGIVNTFVPTTLEVYSKGGSLVERALFLVHLADWVSVFLAEMRGVDIMEIKAIDYLKGELAKV